MQIVCGKSLKQLQDYVEGEIYIYGARTVAMRTYDYLVNNDKKVKGFIVSQKYDNPLKLMNKEVLRIENYRYKQFECIVIAVGDYRVSKKIVEDLKLYSIKKVVIVYYGVIDKYLGCKIYNHNCYIKQAEVGENVSIVVDDSSKLIIEDGVIIESGSILVADNSIIKIKSGTYIGKKSLISATGCSNLVIGRESYFNQINVHVFNKSKMKMNNDTIVHDSINIDVINNSYMCIDRNCIFNSGYISVYNSAKIEIGINCTFGERLSLYVEKQSKIIIGDDCMISINVSMITGLHHIYNSENEKEITNLKPIIVGNHVWCGANCQLISGSEIGDGCVVGAASLVNKVIKANSTCAGIPAKILRECNIRWER